MKKLFDKEYNCDIEIVEQTSNSVRIFHKKKTNKGSDCYQWYDINGKQFKDRFKNK